MSRVVPFALAVLCLLVFVVVANRKAGDKVGVKELKLEKLDKDQVAKIEVRLPVKEEAAAAADVAPAKAAEPPHRVVLVKEGDSWKVHDPSKPEQRFAADQAQVTSALTAVADFQPGELIANKADQLAGYQIDDDHGHHVTVHAADGRTLALVFGRSIKSGSATVRAPGSNDVHIAKGRLGALMMKEVSGWRNKSLFDLKADDIVRVVTTAASGERWGVESAPPAAEAPPAPDQPAPPPAKPEWKLTEPATLPAGFRIDKNQLTRPAAQLAGLRAQDFADGITDAQAGLDAPHVIVEIGHKNGSKLVLHVGKEDADKRVYAKVEGDPQLYLLNNYSAKQLDRKLDDFRDLLLFAATADDIERATFKGAAGAVTVKRTGDGWALVEPKAPPPDFDLAQIQMQVSAALRMRAARLAGVPLTAAGVDKAGTVIDLTLKGGKRQTVRIGAPVPLTEDEKKGLPAGGPAPEPKEFYATGGADQMVYVVAGHAKKRYDKPAELFKKPSPPPGGMGGAPGGGMQGLEGLPPDVRKKLQESIKKGDLPGAR